MRGSFVSPRNVQGERGSKRKRQYKDRGKQENNLRCYKGDKEHEQARAQHVPEGARRGFNAHDMCGIFGWGDVEDVGSQGRIEEGIAKSAEDKAGYEPVCIPKN